MFQRGFTFLMLMLLHTLVTSSPFIVRRVPVLYKRISHRMPEDSLFFDSPLSPVLWRNRRSQPEIDYTDEFSADPFEQPILFPGIKFPPRS